MNWPNMTVPSRSVNLPAESPKGKVAQITKRANLRMLFTSDKSGHAQLYEVMLENGR